MGVHVARMVLVNVDQNGNLMTKDGSKMKDFTTLSQTPVTTHLGFSTEHRILPDDAVPNSADYPSLDDYLALEDTAGYKLKHLDQYLVVTQT